MEAETLIPILIISMQVTPLSSAIIMYNPRDREYRIG